MKSVAHLNDQLHLWFVKKEEINAKGNNINTGQIYRYARVNTVEFIFRMWQVDIVQPEEFIVLSDILNNTNWCIEATFFFEDQTARLKI